MNRVELMAIASLLGGMPWPSSKPPVAGLGEMEYHQLREEYERIQRKESKLSRSERDQIVRRFNQCTEDRRAAQIRAHQERRRGLLLGDVPETPTDA